MAAARRYVYLATLKSLPILGFGDPDSALAVEAFGQAPGKARRHVLNDEHCGLESGRKTRDQLSQRPRTACRAGDRDYAAGSGRNSRFVRRHRRSRGTRQNRHAPEIHHTARAQGVEQAVAHGAQIQTDLPRRLAHEIHRAKLQCPNRQVIGLARRKTAQHDHRPRSLAHDVAERGESVELGHLDIECHDVRIQRMDLPQRVASVTSGAGDAELARRAHQLGHELAHERAVVHHQDGRCRRARQRSLHVGRIVLARVHRPR